MFVTDFEDTGFDEPAPPQPPRPTGPRFIIVYTKDLPDLYVFRRIASTSLFSLDEQPTLPMDFFICMDGRKQNELDYIAHLDPSQFYIIHYSDVTYPYLPFLVANRIYDIPSSLRTFEELRSFLFTPYIHQKQMNRLYELEQQGKEFEPFQTQMDVRPDRRIITFSDLHGDIDALLICLRDCANVIVKKQGYEFDAKKERDPELIKYLFKDCNDQDYERDLHYEWNEEYSDTIVVIIGDLIDPMRQHTSIDPMTGLPSLYYPQVEIKLLHFINALNENALEQGYSGRIIKLCGNHEILNFLGDSRWVDSYVFPMDRVNPYYHFMLPRNGIFQFGNPGFDLYQSTTGTGVLLRINQNVFVHGELSQHVSMKDIEDVNKNMNDPLFDTRDTEFREKVYQLLNHLLQGRTYGAPEGSDDVKINRMNDPTLQDEFCQRVKDDIRQLCKGSCGIDDPEHTIRVFIGHCQQHGLDPDYTRHSLGTVVAKNDRVEILSNETRFHGRNEDRSFGISAECERKGLEHSPYTYQPQIIKVDVAMGRGQLETDDTYKQLAITKKLDLKKGSMSEMQFFYMKTPQVMEIVGDRLHIIRCSAKQMGIHLPRPYYKQLVQHVQRVMHTLCVKVKTLEGDVKETEHFLLQLKGILSHPDKHGIHEPLLYQVLETLYHTVHKGDRIEINEFIKPYLESSIYQGKKSQHRVRRERRDKHSHKRSRRLNKNKITSHSKIKRVKFNLTV